jgi:hypothetical protein
MQFFLHLIVGGLSFFVDIGTFIGRRAIEVPGQKASSAARIGCEERSEGCASVFPLRSHLIFCEARKDPAA